MFSGYARALGESLQSGTGVIEALRLCQRSLVNAEARKRTEVVATMICQGRSLSEAFRQVGGRPLAGVIDIGSGNGDEQYGLEAGRGK